MRYAITSFKGEAPAVHDRALPDNFAVLAENASFTTGILEPINTAATVATLIADAKTIFQFDGQWLSWATDVDAARAPVAASRLYYTGDGAPKVRQGATVYPLALPAPVSAPAVSNLSAPDPATLESCAFVYTHVTTLGEESPPSPVSSLLDTSPGVLVRIDGFAAVPTGRGIVSRRIYRSVTSASGATGFYFVAEIAVAVTSFDHDIMVLPLGEALASSDYDPPPDTMIGLTSLPNGMMAAFSGKDVYFCEPWRPHAWPEKYVLTMDHPVVGLCAFGSYLAVLTSGNPYIIQGTHPDSMATEKLDDSVPCLSRAGIVDIGMAALFPSTEGLMQISPNGIQNLTRSVFTRRQWQGFSPESIAAERRGANYLFLRTVNAYTSYFGGDATGWLSTPDTLDAGGAVWPIIAPGLDPVSVPMLVGGAAGSAFGEQQLGEIVQDGNAVYFVRSTVEAPLSIHNDPLSGDVFMLGQDKRSILRWDDSSSSVATARWRTKRLTTPFPVSFSVLLVKTDRPLVGGDSFAVRVFANGSLAGTITRANVPCRLHARLAEEWEIEIESSIPVVAVTIAQSVNEAMGAAA